MTRWGTAGAESGAETLIGMGEPARGWIPACAGMTENERGGLARPDSRSPGWRKTGLGGNDGVGGAATVEMGTEPGVARLRLADALD